IGSTKPPVKVTVVEPAIAPSSPSSPRGNVNLALGFILGLGLGVGWALIREQLDRTVKSTDQLGELTGAPNLGVVLFDDDASANHVSALDTRSVKSEGYRTIRTNMQFVSIDDPVSSVVVTSAVPNDGKTTISCNLAVALAQGGHKVCLMEADLRNAQVGPFLGISPAVGLTDVLSGRQSLENALVKWGRGLIDVLPAGKAPPNPSELLSSKHMAILIDQLEKQYDYVIIDSAPLLLVSDAAQLAAHAGGALLVVRYGQTSRDAVTRAATALAQVNARMLGTVINAMPAKRRGYGYGYGYGYGASSKDSDRADAKEPDAREPTSPSAGPR
ncbi:MAG: polysaccharide biosynthesis tyrosine autokinase, partial [Candidatus Nanopelagicales bacterium]|nr:polysaccharide biosynthesis tyrosine autokinase [Candidatus Nanopelagicales bacterium]